MANEATIIVRAETQGEEKVAALAKSIEQGFRQGELVLDSFNAQVEKAFAQLEADSLRAAKGVEAAFATLGTRSSGSVEREIEALAEAYRTLEQAGTVSVNDLSRAHEAYERRVEKLRASLVGATQDMGAEETMARRLAQALGRLNARTIDGVERELAEAARDFEALRSSGRLSMEDLALATVAYERKVESLNRELTGLKGQALRELAGSTAAANSQMTLGQKLAERMRGQILGIGAGIAGLYGISKAAEAVATTLGRGQAASYSLEASLRAARLEFGEGAGTVDSWRSSMAKLSKELLVYSQSALTDAASRTVDMTKRLGLAEAQMVELIRRTAELSAGKTDLESGIERVTSALRGEAESAELLGLTLSAEYVQAWYEAHEAHGQAWKDLTEMEKAQVRYRIFLEQTESIQGRAAASVKTLDGAWRYLLATLDNAIVNNEDVAQAAASVAEVIRLNAEDIGDMAAELLRLISFVVRFAVEWRDLLSILPGLYAGAKAVSVLKDALDGVSMAAKIVRGVDLAGWLMKARTAMVAFSAASKANLVFAVATLALDLGLLTKECLEYSKAQRAAADASQEQARILDRADQKARQLAQGLGLQINTMKEFNLLVEQGVIVWNAQAGAWRRGGQAAEETTYKTKIAAKEMDELKGRVGNLGKAYDAGRTAMNTYFDLALKLTQARVSDETKAVSIQLGLYRQRYLAAMNMASQEAREKEALIKNSFALDSQVAELRKGVAKDLSQAQIEAVKLWHKDLESALDAALSLERKYADRVKQLQEDLRQARQSTEEKLRELKRKTMSEEDQWRDRQRQAEENLAKARKAAATGSDEGLAQALELVKKAQSQYEGLAQEVKRGGQTVIDMNRAVREASQGVGEAGKLLESIMLKQEEKLKAGGQAAHEMADGLKTALQQAANLRETLESQKVEVGVGFVPDTTAVDQAKERLKQTTYSDHVIRVREERSSNDSGGSGDSLGFSSGGHVPGVGDGDTVPAYLTPGEFVLRKAAVRQLGLPFLRALNALRGPINVSSVLAAAFIPRVEASLEPLRFASGGVVPSMVAPPDLGTLKLDVGGKSFPVTAKADVVKELADHLRRERLMRPNKG